jgi:glycopeptide antibiotics resistance protein
MNESNIWVFAEIFRQETEGIYLKDQIILMIIEAVIVCIVGVIACRKNRIVGVTGDTSDYDGKTLGRKERIPIKRLLQLYFFLVYLGILFSLTVFRRAEGSREGIVHLYIRLGFGLRGGQPSLRISAYSIFNIMLFIPFGVLGGMLLNSRSRLKGVIIMTLLGACMSLVVESLQLVTGRGMFEVTDLLTNTAGSLLGALLYESFTRKQVSVS